MSRFYASIKGNRGEATRQGSTESGITGHIRGWNCGARVSCFVDNEYGGDCCRVTATGGSNGGNHEFLAMIRYDDEHGYRIFANPDLKKLLPDTFFKEKVEKITAILKESVAELKSKSDSLNGIAKKILLELNYIQSKDAE